MDTAAAAPADVLSLTTSRVRQLARLGQLGAKREGRWQFTAAELVDHLNGPHHRTIAGRAPRSGLIAP